MDRVKKIWRRSLIKTLTLGLSLFLLSFIFDAYNQGQLALVLMLFIGVLSLTVLTGASGQISLGQGALMAVGGYASASLITHLGASIWVGFLVAVFATAIFGLILGVAAARVSGPYLAGTTLVIALALPSMANRFESVLGGNVGLIVDFGTPPTWISNLIEVGYEQWQLWVALPIALIALFFVSNLLTSRAGRSWKAVRDDEIGAAVSGIPIARTKVIVFVVSSSVAGLGGALYGLRGLVGPSVYPVSLSLTLLTAAILGGVGSISGAFIGTLIVVFLPDLIDWAISGLALSEQVTNYLPALLTGFLLLATIILNPAGVMGARHHSGQ
ncbi:MAG: branched-chain amino acid ABC transporter permease [Actinobacteria bacterium]|nr:branched-chain amino acid ABC transporter permease [Actinomycetota bacterium]